MNQEKDPKIPEQNGEPEAEKKTEEAAITETDAAGGETEAAAGTDIEKQSDEETDARPESEAEEEPDPDAQKGEKPESKTEEKKKGRTQKSAGGFVHSSRFRHGSISTVFTVIFIAVVVLLNVIVGILGERFPSVNIDLTKNGMNSLSEDSLKIVGQVKNPTTITIFATKQDVEKSNVFSNYGVQVEYSQVGTLAAKMAEQNSNITVEYVDLDKNPVYASEYKADNLTTGDVLVKTDKRHRVLGFTDLYNIKYNSYYQVSGADSNVEGAIVSALNTVNIDTLPIAAFETGHSESVDMSAYKKLLGDNGFETKDFNLLTDTLPEGAQMVVLGSPTTDLTDDEIKKLDAFLKDTALAGDRSLMVTYNPGESDLPKLSSFLKEWGLEVPQAVVVESDQNRYLSNNPTYLFSDVQSTLKLGGSSSYENFITPQTAPVNILFETKGTKVTYSLAKSSSSSYLFDDNTKETDTPKKESYTTVALSQDLINSGDKSYQANVIAIGSSFMFSEGLVNVSTFDDGKFITDLSKYATGTSNTDTAISIPAKHSNEQDITMTSAMSTFLGLGVFTLLFPLIIAIVGIVVYHKRRNL